MIYLTALPTEWIPVEAMINATISGALKVVLALVVYFIGTRIIKVIRRLIKKALERGSADKEIVTFLDSCAKFGLYAVLIFMILEVFGVNTASIAAVLASAGVAIGLALQGSLSNLAGGVLILLLRPFKIGDYIIEHNTGLEGSVVDIEVFYTKLMTPDNQTVILPNGNLSNNSITNVTTASVRRADIVVGIAYDADMKMAKEVLLEMIQKDEKTLKDKDLQVFVQNLGASSVDLGVRCWFNNEDYWDGKWRLTENIKLILDENKISIPFPQLDVHMKQN